MTTPPAFDPTPNGHCELCQIPVAGRGGGLHTLGTFEHPLAQPGKSEQDRNYNPIPPKSEATLTARVVDAKRGEPMPYDSEQQHTPLTETRNPLSQQERAAIRKEPHTVLVEWLLDDLEAAERTIAELGARELLYIKQGVLLAEAERERDEARVMVPMLAGEFSQVAELVKGVEGDTIPQKVEKALADLAAWRKRCWEAEKFIAEFQNHAAIVIAQVDVNEKYCATTLWIWEGKAQDLLKKIARLSDGQPKQESPK